MKKLLLILVTLFFHNTMAQQLVIQEKVKFIALGDSYTIGESVPQNARWPVQLIDTLRSKNLLCDDAKIIATTGWRTDQLQHAIANANLKNEYSLVALLIGVNNQYQGMTAESYAPEFEALLNTAIKLAGHVKEHVFVVSIPDYGFTPFGKNNQQQISTGIDAFNAVNKSISNKLGIAYINITDISRKGLDDPDLVAADGLHPSGKMYSQWVNRILDKATILEATGSGSDGNSDGVTGAEDLQFGIQLYPNPFRETLTITNLLYMEQPVTVTFIDSNGVTALHQTMMQTDKAEVDTTSLADGSYICEVKERDGRKITARVVKGIIVNH